MVSSLEINPFGLAVCCFCSGDAGSLIRGLFNSGPDPPTDRHVLKKMTRQVKANCEQHVAAS